MPDAEEPGKVRLRVPRSMGRGLWSLLGGVAAASGVALPPVDRCVHGLPMTLGTMPCGCTVATPPVAAKPGGRRRA
jgi:hypothetical protein